MAPQVAISFNESEVVEGTDLVLTIERVGDNRNPLKIPVTAGPAGDQQDQVVEIAAGMSAATLTFSLPDNTYKGPDFQYEATLRPDRRSSGRQRARPPSSGQSWTTTSTRSASLRCTSSGTRGRTSTTGAPTTANSASPSRSTSNARRPGNAVADHHLGPHTHTITVGSRKVSGYAAETNDGSDGDAEFTVALLPGDGYVIDSDRASITVTVRDRDPLPAVVFTLEASLVTEGGDPGSSFGEREIDLIWVAADLPSGETLLRDVTVDYEITGTGPTFSSPPGPWRSPQADMSPP